MNDTDSSVLAAFRRYPGRVALLVLLLVAALTYAFWPKKAAEPEQGSHHGWGGPVPVRLVEARREQLAVELTALGTVTPLNTVTVRSRVDGELTRVLFDEGQLVEANTLLAQIDPRSYEVALAEAEGQQQQNLAQLKNAEANLDLYRGLHEQDSIAKQQLDNQEALVRQYRGTLKIDQARVDNARLQLSFTRIVAPIKGRVGLRKVDAGNLVSSSDTAGIVVITQVDPVAVLFNLPEADLPAVRAALRSGQKLVVEAFSRNGSELLASGTLRTLDNQIDTSTGTVSLKAQFNNANDGLFPNQFVNVKLRVSTLDNAVVLPTAAVQHGSAGTFVYVVQNTVKKPADAKAGKDVGAASKKSQKQKSDDKDNKDVADNKPKPHVSVRRIVLGPGNGAHTAILSGLEAGERVVIEGLDGLREDSEVIIVEDTANADENNEQASTKNGA